MGFYDRLSQASFSALIVVLATLFWGLDNNLIREILDYSSAFIAEVEGLVAGGVNLLVSVFAWGRCPACSRPSEGFPGAANQPANHVAVIRDTSSCEGQMAVA